MGCSTTELSSQLPACSQALSPGTGSHHAVSFRPCLLALGDSADGFPVDPSNNVFDAVDRHFPISASMTLPTCGGDPGSHLPGLCPLQLLLFVGESGSYSLGDEELCPLAPCVLMAFLASGSWGLPLPSDAGVVE